MPYKPRRHSLHQNNLNNPLFFLSLASKQAFVEQLLAYNTTIPPDQLIPHALDLAFSCTQDACDTLLISAPTLSQYRRGVIPGASKQARLAYALRERALMYRKLMTSLPNFLELQAKTCLEIADKLEKTSKIERERLRGVRRESARKRALAKRQKGI
jgi:hypothetical protein